MNSPFVDFGRKDFYSLKNAMGNMDSILPILKERNQKHYAISNYGEVSGWVAQLFKCKDNGIVPILGMQTFINNYRYFYSDDNFYCKKISSDENWKKLVSEISDDEKDWSTIDFSLNIFARTLDGYYNIIKIHNDAQLNGVEKRPRTSDSFLKNHGKGIVATIPSIYSEIGYFIYSQEDMLAKKKYDEYKSYFDDLYLELSIVEDEDYREINKKIISFAKKNNIKMIPVINAHYDTMDDVNVFPVFQKCGKLRGGMSYEVDHSTNMFYKTKEEVWETFKQYHESDVFTEDVMRELFMELDYLCSTFDYLNIDTTPKTPSFPDGEKKLRELAWQGMEKLGYKGNKIYEDRLEYELDNIIRAKFTDYFLMLEDLFKWYSKYHLTSVGRGSAAGSLVLHTIGVTKIDPIKHNLLFERFLDASRLDEIINKGGTVTADQFPDVDSDFGSLHKDSVKEYFAEKYGANNICSIGTIGYLHTKSTLKELGRVHNIEPEIVNELTTNGLEGFDPLEDDEKPLEELKEKFPALDRFLKENPLFERDFNKLYGSINCWGVHAGGILVSDKPLTEQIPVRINKDKLATVWTEGLGGRELGQMGFLKLDILAIETLDIIEEAIDLINSRHEKFGKKVEFDKIPLEETKALGRIENQNNLGVFQFETALALRVAKNMGGIRVFDDIASLSTLMRPAALQNGFDKKFGELRDNPEKVDIPEIMKPYMGKEYGLPIYQESAYFFGNIMAGMDKVSSYKFMKTLYKGKMKGDAVPYWKNKFISGCLKRIKHKEYEITFDNGETKTFTEYDKLKCVDGNEYFVPEIIEKGLEIMEEEK